MIKAVLFDLDNVLYDNSCHVEMSRKAAIKEMRREGLDMSPDKAYAQLENIVEKYGPNSQKHYDMLVGDRNDKSKIIASGVVAYHNAKRRYLKPYGDTIATVTKLKSLGYKVGVVTDGLAVKQWTKLIQLGLGEIFDCVVVSEEVGVEKPEPKIFQKACDKLGLSTDECAFVGDRLDKDIVGANKTGMVSIRILRGNFKDQKPGASQEKPRYEIRRLAEIPDLIGP